MTRHDTRLHKPWLQPAGRMHLPSPQSAAVRLAVIPPCWQDLPRTGWRGYARCMPISSRIALLVLLVLLGLSACRKRTADLGMSDSAFVLVMSELKVVADANLPSEALRGQRRAAVLRKRGVTAAQLEALSAELNAHPQHAKRLWTAIEVRANKAPQAKQ